MVGRIVRDSSSSASATISKAEALTLTFLTTTNDTNGDANKIEVGKASPAMDFEKAIIELTLSFAKDNDVKGLRFIPFAARSFGDLAG